MKILIHIALSTRENILLLLCFWYYVSVTFNSKTHIKFLLLTCVGLNTLTMISH